MKTQTRANHRSILTGALFTIALACGLAPLQGRAETPAEVADLRDQWEQINFVSPEQEREAQFAELVTVCEGLLATHGSNPEALTWCGIVKSSYAGAKGGLGALSHAKAARRDFERAIDIKPDVAGGAALTSLGTLYARVPGWPIGFGDDKKARKYLEQGLQVNPEGIDNNFFMAEFLAAEGETARAREALLRALEAPARPGRAISDAGRRVEINTLLETLEASSPRR